MLAIGYDCAPMVALYTAGGTNDLIYAFGEQGNRRGELVECKQLCIRSNGNLLVAEGHGCRVQEVTATGEHVRFIGGEGLAPVFGSSRQVQAVAATDDLIIVGVSDTVRYVRPYGCVPVGVAGTQAAPAQRDNVFVFNARSGEVMRSFQVKLPHFVDEPLSTNILASCHGKLVFMSYVVTTRTGTPTAHSLITAASVDGPLSAQSHSLAPLDELCRQEFDCVRGLAVGHAGTVFVFGQLRRFPPPALGIEASARWMRTSRYYDPLTQLSCCEYTVNTVDGPLKLVLKHKWYVGGHRCAAGAPVQPHSPVVADGKVYCLDAVTQGVLVFE